MDIFFPALRRSIELHAKGMRRGQVFLPAYLKKSRFLKLFQPVAGELANRLNLPFKPEVSNPFQSELEVGWKRQMVDYVFGDLERPRYFLEVESLDRAQLYLFVPYEHSNNESKLWYYWATVCKKIAGDKRMPRYFVWFLILPDERVTRYPIWDCDKQYPYYDRKLIPLVLESPFKFYDHLIKTAARQFLKKPQEIRGSDGKWIKNECLQDYQSTCELIFITCTGRQVVMSRGRDEFDPAKEKRLTLRW